MSEETFRSLVLSDATVTANVGTRMYSNMLPPEATTPAITFFVVAGKAFADTHANLYKMTRFQVNIYHTVKATVITIYEAMLALLHRYTGTYNSQVIVYIVHDFEMTTYEPETKLYRQIVDFKMVTEGA